MAPSTSNSHAKALLELEDEIQGDQIGSTDYRFSRIGVPVPIKSGGSAPYDSENEIPPLQPLAVSERFRLIFVAHSDGFYVARTHDVLASAQELKEKNGGLSVQDICVVDISIGKVSILALSGDDSLLAVTVGSKIHFFPVSTLLHKEQNPSYSFSIDDSSFIRDLQWAKHEEKIYLVLSSVGKLYCGHGQKHANYVMDNVDAVGWSANGDCVAVVRNNTISIFSSQFEEKLSLVPSFKLILNDSDAESVIKVDAVRWVRPDSIVLGCIYINDNGEETYALQTITCKNGEIDNDSSKPIVQSFTNVFADFRSDVVPLAIGPHLFFSYLVNHGIAFVANRKNLDQHILLLGWSIGDGTNETAMIEMLDDKWTPEITALESGDDILVLGLAIDKVSQQKGLKMLLGGNEEKEVSPCCLCLCLASDGGLSIFHFASAAGDSATSPVFVCPDEIDNTSAVALSEVKKQDVEDRARKSNKLDKSESDRKAAGVIEKSTQQSLLSKEDYGTRNQVDNAHPNLVSEDQHKPSVMKLSLDLGGLQSPLQVKQGEDVNDSSLHASQPANLETLVNSLSVEAMHTSIEAKICIGSVSATSSNNYSQTFGKSIQTDPIIAVQGRTMSTGFSNSASFTGTLRSDEKSPLQTFGNIQQKVADDSNITVLPLSGGHPQSSLLWSQSDTTSVDFSKQRVMPWAQSIKSSSPLQQNVLLQKYSKPQPVRNSSDRIQPNQFHTAEEMTRELDDLLQEIEGDGGFLDACITSQESSVITLEEGIQALSEKCRMWRGIMDERKCEIQVLFDKTAKVLAKKVYMEGIFKQATDSRYLDMWSRQKLCSELYLKQVHINDMRKVLTNQLIELEKHFNMLEINAFGGGSGGMTMNLRGSQCNHGPGRNAHSFHSLRGAVNAQLTAAEQLSGNLSKLMTDLNIDFSVGRQNVRKELFETIGLSYDDNTYSSPGKEIAWSTPLNRERSVSLAANGQSRRKLTNAAKSSEPETARRRRDSLDRNWASFEPPKTTVKRILLQEDHKKESDSSSSLSAYKQQFGSKLHERSTSAGSNFSGASSTSFQQKLKSTGFPEISVELCDRRTARAPLWARDHEKPEGKLSSALKSSMPSLVEPKSTSPDQGIQEGGKVNNESPTSTTPFLVNSTLGPSKLAQQPETKLQKPSLDIQNSELNTTTEFSFSGASSAASAFNISGKFKHKSQTTETLVSTMAQSLNSSLPPAKFDFPSIPISSFSSPSSLNVNLQTSASTTPLFASPTPEKISLPSISDNFSSGEATTDGFTSIPKASCGSNQSTSLSQSSLVASQRSLSFHILDPQNVGPLAVIRESEKHNPKPLSQIPTSNVDTKDDMSSGNPQSIPNVTSNSQVGFLTQSKSTNEHSSDMQSANQTITSGFSSSTLGMGLNEKQKAATSQTANGEKNDDIVSTVFEEDEMEEEAPEVNQVTEQTLGNLAGFGLGVPNNVPIAKPNPFGASLPYNIAPTQTSSTFPMTAPAGELFRPASFNFSSLQPLQPPTSFSSISSGGFTSGSVSQTPTGSGFGQPSQIGRGNNALGSVLGTFGQSRQLGSGLPGSCSASAIGIGTSLVSNNSNSSAGSFGVGGFGGASAVGGGFSNLASTGRGFAAAATGGGGFASAATGIGGFAAAATASGFSATLTAGAGGGMFGGFSNQQGGGGFSDFGSSVAAKPASQLFTQMRK
ncbi:unnamed protein product [Cuscuta europaea]|uniref:Nuclear pore complex protein NUP214 n=1 Tax=Cuscuta europaea TaxID=41803 RepID=A0A9P0VN73_CUSEU|nr:unnamed protein product [Cuscuta europaea]